MKIKMCVLALVILLLTACSNEKRNWVGVDLPVSTKPVQEEITASPSVIVYGISSVTNGFVVAAEDIKKLLDAFNALIACGHTVLIIEHNMEIIKCADHVIDLGPEGGQGGGYLVCEGAPEVIAACKDSYTGKALRPYVDL